MITMLTHLKALVRDNKAATAIEYGLIAALIAAAIAAAVGGLGTDLDALFTNLAKDI